MAGRQNNTAETEDFIANDEGLYNMAKRALRQARGNRRLAARAMLMDLEAMNGDLIIPTQERFGTRFTLTGIINAMGNL